MLTFVTALRLVVIGQELLIAGVFLFGAGGRAPRVSGALLMLSIVGYLYTSDTVLSSAIPLIEPIMSLLALAVPFALWLFARAVFEAPWPRPVVLAVSVSVALTVWGIYLAGETVDSAVTAASNTIIRLLSLVIIGHALWLTLTGRPDDLIERRRTFRLFFVGIISLQAAAVLLVELVLGDGQAPSWLALTNVAIIAGLTLGLALPMLRLNAEFFDSGPDAATAVVREPDTALGPADSVCHRKLLELMDAGFYRKTALTIAVLAAELDFPEHRLRRLINGHLGYRNFSAFLNGYRIAAAQQELADPEKARTPVLTIALDLGYGSLGPFNRAFKATTGRTPTEYRRQTLGANVAESE